MIVSVTANTTMDQTLFVPSFVMNQTIRATRIYYSMGGKPTDASLILGTLGIPSLALGFAAGANGERIKTMLHERGVQTDFIQVDGESRMSTVIVSEDGSGQSTITTDTLHVTQAHIDTLYQRYVDALPQASCIVLGGTVPKEVPPHYYPDLIGMARECGIPVIFDADEPNLSRGLAARPTYIKPNEHELGALAGFPIADLESAFRAGRFVLEKYGTASVISLGAAGGLAVLPDRAYRIPPLKVEVVSTSGAGDGVLAGITASVARRQPIEEGLRLGFAIASAVVMMPGTADCRPEDVDALLPQVELIPYPG